MQRLSIIFVHTLTILCIGNGIAYAAIGTVIQFTDFHMDIAYDSHGSRKTFCHDNGTAMDDDLGSYGDPYCDSPMALVEYAINEIRQAILIHKPSFLLWTGDSVPHIPDVTYNETYVVDTIERITNMLNISKVIPVFGNHDYWPGNAFPDRQSYVYNRTFANWKRWISDTNRDTFLRGGYYKYELPGNALILALNTNLYYRFNTAVFNDTVDPAGQFGFMEETLRDSKARNISVLLVAHVPPGVFERSPNFTWFRPEYNRRFLDIIVTYASTIKWMIFGHHHTDTFQIIKNTNGEPVQLMLMSPSITPMYSDLPGGTAVNPAYRVFTYDTDNWEIRDIETFYVNLTLLNTHSQEAQWISEYNHSSAYGITGPITATAMNTVLQKMKTDDSLFAKYLQFNSVSYNVSKPDTEFRLAQLCAIEFVNYDDYNRCMENGTATPQNFSASKFAKWDHFGSLLSVILMMLWMHISWFDFA